MCGMEGCIGHLGKERGVRESELEGKRQVYVKKGEVKTVDREGRLVSARAEVGRERVIEDPRGAR
jgi:hypothetical protein